MSETIKSSRDLLAEFIKNGKEFTSLAKSIPLDQLKELPIAGEWSAAYVLHHMCDGELHYATRFLNNLAEDTPNIFPFNEDIYPERLSYENRDALASLAAIEGIQVVTANILSAIPESGWSRTSKHEDRGLLTLAQLVETASGHRKSHAGQLQELINAL
jgi:uncharacterized damage-inducible protein DinB